MSAGPPALAAPARSWPRLALSAAIGLGFVVFVELWIGWRTLLRPWGEVAPAAVLAGAGLLLVTHAFRALRLHDHFGAPVKGRRAACLSLVLRHNLFNSLLPMRAGELAFPVLMARTFDIGPRASVPGVLWFRLLDLHALSLLAVPALAAAVPDAVLVPGIAAWLALPWAGYRIGRRLARRAEKARGRFATSLHRLLLGLPQREAVFWRAELWTLACWGLKLPVLAWILSWFAPLELELALLGAIGGELTSVLPIHGLAGLGTYEAGVVAGLVSSELAPERLVQAAVNLHLFILSVTVVGGGLALLPGQSQHPPVGSRSPEVD